MAFTLNSDITIGQFKKVKPHHVKIEHSLTSYVNKCLIKMPASAHLVCENKAEFGTVQTAKQFVEGDKVIVNLGYNGKFKNEFEGFVARINVTTPVEVECEGYSYQLRKKTPVPKTFKKAELKEVLKYIITGTDIVLDSKIPSCIVEKVVINGENGVEVLEMIKRKLGDLVYLHFHNKILYGGLKYLNTKGVVKYRLGWNVIKDNNLKQREAINDKITIIYKGKKKDGTNIEAVIKSKGQSKIITTEGVAGNGGETKIFVTHEVRDEATLKELAEAKLKKLSYDGYEGKITAFLQPFCQHGWKAELKDKSFPERSGDYLITSVEVTYGMNGARRTVELGEKI